jgi:hypothetical protein
MTTRKTDLHEQTARCTGGPYMNGRVEAASVGI